MNGRTYGKIKRHDKNNGSMIAKHACPTKHISAHYHLDSRKCPFFKFDDCLADSKFHNNYGHMGMKICEPGVEVHFD